MVRPASYSCPGNLFLMPIMSLMHLLPAPRSIARQLRCQTGFVEAYPKALPSDTSKTCKASDSTIAVRSPETIY